jgi:hypothetical protein
VSFLHVSDDLLAAYGKVVVAAAAVEHAGHEIALALDLKPPILWGKVRESVLARLNEPLRDHVRCTPEEVRDWFSRADSKLKARNRIVHSRVIFQKQEGVLVPVTTDLRTHRYVPSQVDDLEKAASGLAGLLDEGYDLSLALLLQAGEGGYVRGAHDPGWLDPYRQQRWRPG